MTYLDLTNILFKYLPLVEQDTIWLTKVDKVKPANPSQCVYRELITIKPVEGWESSISGLVASDQILTIKSDLYSHAYNKIMHIPMMDFSIKPSSNAIDQITKAFNELDLPKGVLLNSGNSYHYYGYALLNKHLWYEFMYKCLLIPELVDVKHIGHRLLYGYGSLRINTTEYKPQLPFVVGYT